MRANKRNFPTKYAPRFSSCASFRIGLMPTRAEPTTDQSCGMGHAYLRGAPQDGKFRLRSACSHRATAVRARPCDPAIARVRRCRWGLDLFGNRVLGNGSIVITE